jgi:hypothetical protein
MRIAHFFKQVTRPVEPQINQFRVKLTKAQKRLFCALTRREG